MNRSEFLLCLGEKLNALPQNEIEKAQGFYSEMIDDRIEDGMCEEEAVAALGDIDEIVKTALLDIPLTTLMKAKIKTKNGLKAWEIVLIILGFPVWFPLLAGFFAVILGVYVSVRAVIISLYAAVAALMISGIIGVFSIFFAQSLSSGLFILGSGLFFTGIGLLAFFPVTKLSVWLVKLTGLFLHWVKSLFIKKEVVS